MLSQAKVVAFAAVSDLDRACAFYGEVLGLTIESQDEYAVVARAGDAAIRIIRAEREAAAEYTVLGFEVVDIAAELAVLKTRGVIAERYNREQDANGVWTFPSGDKVAWLKDPDGNVLSLTQPA